MKEYSYSDHPNDVKPLRMLNCISLELQRSHCLTFIPQNPQYFKIKILNQTNSPKCFLFPQNLILKLLIWFESLINLYKISRYYNKSLITELVEIKLQSLVQKIGKWWFGWFLHSAWFLPPNYTLLHFNVQIWHSLILIRITNKKKHKTN